MKVRVAPSRVSDAENWVSGLRGEERDYAGVEAVVEFDAQELALDLRVAGRAWGSGLCLRGVPAKGQDQQGQSGSR